MTNLHFRLIASSKVADKIKQTGWCARIAYDFGGITKGTIFTKPINK